MTRGYRRYALFLFWLASLMSFLDRHILSVLLEPIKADLHFSDTELGLLSGLAYAGFYILFGLPLARLIERSNRRNILSAAIAAWSFMAASCGLAGGFASMFVGRAGVAIGEAGGAPAIQSLMADHFPPESRGRAFAILSTAVNGSVLIAYLLGGLLAERFGWRLTFLIVATPGLLLAFLIRSTLAEPARGASEQRQEQEQGEVPPFLATLRTLWLRPAYRNCVLAGAAASMAAWGSGVWLTSFLVRLHGLSVGQAGVALGLIFGIVGTLGTLTGGALADRLAIRTGDRAWQMRLCALSLLIAIPTAAFAYLASSVGVALVMLSITLFFFHIYAGPLAANVQALAELRMRATASAVFSLVGGLVSMGLGPLLIGAASDLFGPEYGPDALRYSLLSLVTACYLIAAFFFWRASRTVQQDLGAAAQAPPGSEWRSSPAVEP